MSDGRYPPNESHGIIGDLRSAALVSTDGTIDWFCPERFDRPSVFASVLDEERGGAWRLAPTGEVTRTQQYYLPDTAVLVMSGYLEPDNAIAAIRSSGLPFLPKPFALDHLSEAVRSALDHRVAG